MRLDYSALGAFTWKQRLCATDNLIYSQALTLRYFYFPRKFTTFVLDEPSLNTEASCNTYAPVRLALLSGGGRFF